MWNYGFPYSSWLSCAEVKKLLLLSKSKTCGIWTRASVLPTNTYIIMYRLLKKSIPKIQEIIALMVRHSSSAGPSCGGFISVISLSPSQYIHNKVFINQDNDMGFEYLLLSIISRCWITQLCKFYPGFQYLAVILNRKVRKWRENGENLKKSSDFKIRKSNFRDHIEKDRLKNKEIVGNN